MQRMVFFVIVSLALAACGDDEPQRKGGGGIMAPINKAQVQQARAQMRAFSQAIDAYRLAFDKLPASLDDLTAPRRFVQSVPPDPWGNDYEFLPRGGGEYELLSAGPDKQFETDDDIWWPEGR